MTIGSIPVIFSRTVGQSIAAKMPLSKAVAFAAGLGLSVLSYPVHAAPATGGDTVQGLYDALVNTMKNGRTLGQSGRFTQLAPVIRRTFDISSMTRLSVGSSWAGLTEAQRQQVSEGSVSTCARWRIPVVVGYAAARFRGDEAGCGARHVDPRPSGIGLSARRKAIAGSAAVTAASSSTSAAPAS